jgi:putative DeoR family transcriptional regulator (stage III sporulation protein D)
LKGIVEERAIKLGEHIVENKDTVRRTAAEFGISKSTVHTDVTKRRSFNLSFFNHISKFRPWNSCHTIPFFSITFA